MEKVKIEDVEYNVPPIVNILLNQHRSIEKYGDLLCSECGHVWPCATRILIVAYSELLQERNKCLSNLESIRNEQIEKA